VPSGQIPRLQTPQTWGTLRCRLTARFGFTTTPDMSATRHYSFKPCVAIGLTSGPIASFYFQNKFGFSVDSRLCEEHNGPHIARGACTLS